MNETLLILIGVALGAIALFSVDRFVLRTSRTGQAPVPRPTGKALRDALLFLGGLAGVLHETVVADRPRESLLVMFAAMMGLPAFLRADERRDDEKKNGGRGE